MNNFEDELKNYYYGVGAKAVGSSKARCGWCGPNELKGDLERGMVNL